jgi:hypothetical protein
MFCQGGTVSSAGNVIALLVGKTAFITAKTDLRHQDSNTKCIAAYEVLECFLRASDRGRILRI